jgi:DNA (cytosine-5)-methyltransferase 1
MRVLSLFSGGGLGDYGLELAGMEIVGQVEIDDYCQKILKLRWPNVPKWGAIENVKTEYLPKCDLICGGFPCQDISAGGSRKGLCGSHSGLWKEFSRIISEIRPRFVLLENSSHLVRRGLMQIVSELTSFGYDSEWEIISSQGFGSNHKRVRLYLVAYAPSKRLERRIFTQAAWEVREKTAGCFKWGNESKILRKDDGNPTRVDESKLIGNGIFVPAFKWIGERIMEFDQLSRRIR